MRKKLFDITIEDNKQYAQQPSMWCKGDATPKLSHGNIVLPKKGTYDFTTFFNALSYGKYLDYTIADNFHLHIEASGEIESISWTFCDTMTYSPQEMGTIVEKPGRRVEIDANIPNWQEESTFKPVLIGFTVKTNGKAKIENAYWYSNVNENSTSQIELAVCTTTFKKEAYIMDNIDTFINKISKSADDVSKHCVFNVVDNASSLPIEYTSRIKAEHPEVNIVPNVNSGGAGGFARGMIESMRNSPKATHVLLMDDDVWITASSIIKTYNLLSILKPEWQSAFISGANLSMLEPELRHEDTGFMGYDGYCHPVKPSMRMTVLHDIVTSESFVKPNEADPRLKDFEQSYAAWWYCCIPMTEIEKRGLPLPIFIRLDDVEYALRDTPKLITMNGICIWHEPFFMRYDYATEGYQDIRNSFIIRASSDSASLSNFEEKFFRKVQVELKKFNYAGVEAMLQGFEDFLKGPDVVFAPGFAEKRFMETHKTVEKYYPLNEMSDTLLDLGIDWRRLTADDVDIDYPRNIIQRTLDYISFNGQQRLKNVYTKHGKVAIINAFGGLYPAGKLRRANTIVAVDTQNRKCSIRRKDNDKFNELWKRYNEDIKFYKSNKDHIESQYKKAYKNVTSIKFWEKYLGIQKKD